MPARKAVKDDHLQLDLFTHTLPAYQTLETLRLPGRETVVSPPDSGGIGIEDRAAPDFEGERAHQKGAAGPSPVFDPIPMRRKDNPPQPIHQRKASGPALGFDETTGRGIVVAMRQPNGDRTMRRFLLSLLLIGTMILAGCRSGTTGDAATEAPAATGACVQNCRTCTRPCIKQNGHAGKHACAKNHMWG